MQTAQECCLSMCGQLVKTKENNQGLFTTKSIVLLVGAIYKCSNNHTVYSTDPRYLKKIDRILPFVLLHRTGFTRTFIHSAISLAQEGLSMLAIARHICAVRKEYVSDRLLYAYAGEQLTEEKIQSLAMSNNTTCLIHPIARCFIVNFLENEHFYVQQMMHVKVEKCIRIDHTFKVASNIGYLQHDGKWVTQYGYL